MPQILDQFGKPIDRAVLAEPQTASVSALQNDFLQSAISGLTPARLAATLAEADAGNIFAQHRLFADMEERDAHLGAEMGKRKMALLKLDWAIVPPRNASAAEKAHAEWLTEVLEDAVDPIEDLILALMDAVGHGFAATELEWRQEGAEWLPAFIPRPQEWFQTDSKHQSIRLRDMSVDGAQLKPFGWVFHTHGKAKTGYIARMGLHRVLSWPFLYKAYAIGDFAEFLETFGLPLIIGKYFSGASPDEKASLLRAVSALGHDARAIMPAEMELEIKECSSSSGSKSVHLEMVDWADRAQSKAILGQTMSAEAKSTGLGSGNADLHREVREDILAADARQIAGTLTRDLLYPLIALNRGNLDGLRRCPRLVFDTGNPEDMALYADALPKLVGIGMRVPAAHVHDKLRIPQATDNEPVLSVAGSPTPTVKAPPPAASATARLASLAGAPGGSSGQPDTTTHALTTACAPHTEDWLSQIMHLVETAPDMASLQDALLEVFGNLDTAALTRIMAAGFALAELKGMDSVDGAGSAGSGHAA